MEKRKKFIQVAGHSLYTEFIAGDKTNVPTLVFLHDALGCTATWKQFPELVCRKTGFNGLIFDRPGYGKSSPVTGSRTADYLERAALDILPAVLQELNIRQPVLIGHSDGGTIALIYHAHKKTGFPFIVMAAHIMVEPITRRGVSQTAPGLLKEDQINKLMKYHGDKAVKLVEDWRDIWLSDEFRNWNIEDEIREIRDEGLVLQGMQDEYATPEHATGIVDAVGDEKVSKIMIDDCGHFPYRQYPEEVSGYIYDFLDRGKWLS